MATKKVALMVGHGKMTNGVWDCGCAYAGYTEAALMLPITKSAVKYLRQSGVTVISDADTDNNRNMVVDVAWANRENVDVYISVHCDWYKAPTGVYPLYVSDRGKKLADALNSAIKSGMGMKSRGVCRRTDLYELNATDAPACILETGSIKADIKTLKNYDKYGKCIAKGICNYLGVKFKELAEPVALYRVRKTWADAKSQVGAYKDLANAKKIADEKGLNVYDDKGTLIYQGKKKVVKSNAETSAQKLIAKAKEVCWAYGTPTEKWAYKTGNPTSEYNKLCGSVSRVTKSDCGYFIKMITKATGLGAWNPLNDKVPAGFEVIHKGSKVPDGLLKAGDIIWYKKTSGQHTLMYFGDNKIAEAGREIRFPVIRKNDKKYNKSDVKHNTIKVARAK